MRLRRRSLSAAVAVDGWSGRCQVKPMRGTVAAVAFLAASIGYGMALGGQYKPFFDSLSAAFGFGVETIEINGLVEANSEEIADRIDIGLHSSLLTLNADKARARIAEIPWVADVEVKKVYPDKLVVNLSERKAFALWQQGGQLSVVDQTGAVMTNIVDDRHAELPLVVGEGANVHAAEAVELINSSALLKPRIKAAQFVAERRWNLVTVDNVEIRLPEENPQQALARVADLDRTKRLLDRDITVVDMRAPDRILVKLSDAAADQRREMLKSRVKKKASDT
eukprot:gene20506-21148_t